MIIYLNCSWYYSNKYIKLSLYCITSILSVFLLKYSLNKNKLFLTKISNVPIVESYKPWNFNPTNINIYYLYIGAVVFLPIRLLILLITFILIIISILLSDYIYPRNKDSNHHKRTYNESKFYIYTTYAFEVLSCIIFGWTHFTLDIVGKKNDD